MTHIRQFLAVAFRHKSPEPFRMFPFRSEAIMKYLPSSLGSGYTRCSLLNRKRLHKSQEKVLRGDARSSKLRLLLEMSCFHANSHHFLNRKSRKRPRGKMDEVENHGSSRREMTKEGSSPNPRDWIALRRVERDRTYVSIKQKPFPLWRSTKTNNHGK